MSILLYKYKLRNKKGQLTGKFLKQVYNVDIYGDVIKIGGPNEPGYNMYFWPEGTLAGEVITEKTYKDVRNGHEIETDRSFIYLIA